MPNIRKINHVAIVVKDIDQAIGFWETALGLKVDHIENVPSQQAKVAFIPVGESEVELVQPTTEDSGMASFLEKKGEGMHHLCVEVDDIDAMLLQLTEQGVRLINEEAVELPGRKMAFVHPKSTNGVLVELYQLI